MSQTYESPDGDSSDRVVADLVDEYLRRERAGEALTLETFVGEHGLEAEELEGLVPMMRTLLDLERSRDAIDALVPSSPSSGGGVPSKRSTERRIGDYHILGEIGRGGMGVVYEAWQDSVDRRVALKILPSGVALDDRNHVRFLREARIAAKLDHENVVRIYGMGIEEDTPYYAMEMVEGETLAQILTRLRDGEREGEARPEPPRGIPVGPGPAAPGDRPSSGTPVARWCGDLAEAFAGVAEGLEHAHRTGVIHRDIKPSNLIVDPRGRVRILDFGLARLEGQESLTVSGDLVGTPQYMSPEQAMAKRIPIDHRTDIYSLGATMYEALTWHPPFRGKDHSDTLSQIITRDPRPPRQWNPRIPADLETIVLKCLRKAASDEVCERVALSPDGERLATARNNSVHVWDVATGERHGQSLVEPAVSNLFFGADGQRLCTGIRVWDVARPEEPRAFDLPDPWGGAGLRFQNRLVVWTAGASRGNSSDPARGGWFFEYHGKPPDHAAIDASGRYLATAVESADVPVQEGSVRMWNLRVRRRGSLQDLERLPFYSAPVPFEGRATALAFDPEGKRLAIGAEDGTITLWGLPEPPADLREMQLRTWLNLGMWLDADGSAETIPWYQWQLLRDEDAARRGDRSGSTPCHRFMRQLNRARALTVDGDGRAAREAYRKALSHVTERSSEQWIVEIHYAELLFGHCLLLADQTDDPADARRALGEIESVADDGASDFVRSVLAAARKLIARWAKERNAE